MGREGQGGSPPYKEVASEGDGGADRGGDGAIRWLEGVWGVMLASGSRGGWKASSPDQGARAPEDRQPLLDFSLSSKERKGP